jgi:hypothetical protein
MFAALQYEVDRVAVAPSVPRAAGADAAHPQQAASRPSRRRPHRQAPTTPSPTTNAAVGAN